jgi:hypothetical protein
VLLSLRLALFTSLEGRRVSSAVAVPAQRDQVFTPKVVLVAWIAWPAIGIGYAEVVNR